MRYPVHFQPEPEGGFTATFRDIPEAVTHGLTIEEARDMAADVLLMSMDVYFDEKRQVPAPSALQNGEELVALPLTAWVKVLLLNEMLGQRVRASELGRRMGSTPQTVNRLIDLHHASRIEEVVRALDVLGKRLDVFVEAA